MTYKFVPGQRVFHDSLKLYGTLIDYVCAGVWHVQRDGASQDPRGWTNSWNERYLQDVTISKPTPTALDTQVGGSHYKKTGIQPVEYCHANNIGFMEGCVIKYISRYKAKGGKQDLEKAKHFIDLLIALEYPDHG